MEFEYKVLTFPSSAEGQAEKMRALNHFAERGWSLESETVNQSSFNTVGAAQDAACACFLCGPFCAPFLMNQEKHKVKGEISVTLKRSIERRDQEAALKEKQEAESSIAEQARLLEQRANIESIMNEAKARKGAFYPDSKIQGRIAEYLEADRKQGGPIPSYLDSYRKGSSVFVCDINGNVLAEYTLDD